MDEVKRLIKIDVENLLFPSYNLVSKFNGEFLILREIILKLFLISVHQNN